MHDQDHSTNERDSTASLSRYTVLCENSLAGCAGDLRFTSVAVVWYAYQAFAMTHCTARPALCATAVCLSIDLALYAMVYFLVCVGRYVPETPRDVAPAKYSGNLHDRIT
jgi:hypothetical protein